jgi:hypothetical protein
MKAFTADGVFKIARFTDVPCIILPVVLCGRESWLLTLSEERRLRLFENWALRGIFGPERNGVTGKWVQLHSEELYDFYWSTNIRLIRSRK